MKELVEGLQLTRLGRLLWACLAICALIGVLCWALFGWLKLLLLLAVCGLSYCSASYLYYSSEGSQWRETVDRCYEEIFSLALSYEHTPPRLQPPVESSTKLSSGRVQLPSPQDSSQNVGKPQPSKMCHKESQKMIQLIMQHFIHEWYDGITSDVEFPEDVQKLLEHVALEVNIRLKQIDLEEIVCEIATLVLPYLEAVNEAGERDFNGVKVFDVTHEKCVRDFESNEKVEHWNLRSREQELRYYRQALDTLIQCAAPNEYTVCDPACMFVREILLANIIEPLLDLICDPDFLYESIPKVLSKASKEKVDQELADIQLENEKLEKQLSRGRLMVKTHGQQRLRFHSFSSSRFGHSFNEGSPGLVYPASQSPYSKGSPMTRPVSIAGMPTLADSRGSPRGWRLGKHVLHEQISKVTWNSDSDEIETQSVPLPLSSQGLDQPSSPPQLHSVPLSTSLPLQTTTERGIDVYENYYNDDVGYEMTVSEPDVVYVQLAPIYIERHVRVVSGGSNNYIAYVLKFPTRMLNKEELKELNVCETDRYLEAMKRYSEFRMLHVKLLKSSSFARHIKGLELPEKGRVSSIVSKLPFISADPDLAFLLERKQGLEKYLQSISSVEEIADSDNFHEFLLTGVQALKEAHVVSKPQKAKRRSFLGIVKTPTEDTQKAEPIPKRLVEVVLSGYLNTHLPLPCCSFHSIHTIRRKRHKPSHHTPEVHHPYSLRLHNSRVIGNPELNLAGSSPTQSFASSVSTEDPSATATPVAAYPAAGGELPSSLEEKISNTTTATTISTSTTTNSTTAAATTTEPVILSRCNSEELKESTSGGTDNNEGTGNLSDTGIHQRTTCNAPPTPLGNDTETSLRLRLPLQENVAKKERGDGNNCEQSPSKKPRMKSGNETRGNHSFLKKIKRLIFLFMVYTEWFFSFIYYIMRKGLEPITRFSTLTVVKEQEKRVPLSNALFSLGTEVSKKHCPELWVCSEDIQLSLLVVVGGASERFIWKELKEVVYAEENWARALYHLRHTLWPQGELMKQSKIKINEMERIKLKEKAAEAIKMFLPDFLPYIVGAEDYNAAVVHCLNCLANPRINRHFILRIVEVFLMKLIPEINSKNFKVQLERLRTIKFAHGRSSILNFSAFRRRAALHKSDTI